MLRGCNCLFTQAVHGANCVNPTVCIYISLSIYTKGSPIYTDKYVPYLYMRTHTHIYPRIYLCERTVYNIWEKTDEKKEKVSEKEKDESKIKKGQDGFGGGGGLNFLERVGKCLGKNLIWLF